MAAMVSSSLENHVDLNGNSDKYSDSIHGSQPIKEGEDDDKGWIRVEKCRDQGKSGACPSATTHPNRVIRHQGINKNASDEGRANSFTRKQGSSFSIQSPLCFVPVCLLLHGKMHACLVDPLMITANLNIYLLRYHLMAINMLV